MKLRFTQNSLRDLVGIADYLRDRNPQAATRVRDAIIESLQNLVTFPRIGRRQTTSNVRKLVTLRYRYLVYYALDESADEIAVLAIYHPARDRPHSDA